MDFDNLKVIWDRQNAEKLYAFDEAAFSDLIERKCRETVRRDNLQKWTLIGIYLVVSAVLIGKPILMGEDYRRTLGSIFALGVAGYVYLQLRRQRKGESRFDQSLSGILKQAVHRQKGLVRMGSTMMVWLGIPYAIFASVNFFVFDKGASYWLLAAMMLPIPMMYVVVRWGLANRELPRLRELESMERKFTES